MQLKRRHTLKRAYEFAHVRRHGASSAGRFIVLSAAESCAPAQAQAESQFGIIVTKKVGNAVTRNRLRRQLREIVREKGEKLATGRQIVIIIRVSATKASFEQLRGDFAHCLKRYLKKAASARPAAS